jgi:2-oxoglutarate ferredoxin oxidoreductase subunit beta
VVEVLSQCPTYYGRKNGKGDAVAMMQWYRDNTIPVRKDDVPKAEFTGTDGKTPIGVFVDIERTEYTDAYASVMERAAAKLAGTNGGQQE